MGIWGNLFQSISVCNDKSCAWFKVALEHLLEQLREFKLVQVLHLEFNTFLRETEIEQMCKIKIHCKEKETQNGKADEQSLAYG